MNQDEFDETANEQLAALLRMGVALALDEKDFAQALERFDAAVPELYPELAGGIAEGLPRKPFSMALLRDIWGRVPRPDNEWRPRPLPKPERNAPCPCGSGAKFKACCADMPPMPFGPRLSLLSFVLERMPLESYAGLPWKRLDPEELAFTARQWVDDGEFETAQALLEPLLADLSKLDSRHEDAFDELGNLYLETGEDEQRVALVRRMQTAPDSVLRAIAWQRWASMCADRGEREASWEAFATAQKIDPDHPALAHLEVTMLLAEGQIERAQSRAKFWARRLERRQDVNPELIALLDECAKDPRRWLRGIENGDFGSEEDLPEEDFDDLEDDEDVLLDTAGVERFLALLDMPEPECRYRLEPRGDSAGELIADAALADLEAEWREISPLADEDEDTAGDIWEDLDWVDWLEAHPLALQSFAVLEALLDVIDEIPFGGDEYNEQIDQGYDAIPAHALALLRLVIAKNGAEGKKLEWGWLDNRPALRLVETAAYEVSDPKERIEILEWLVYTLNPEDNQGNRDSLLHTHLREGEPERAWKVCEAFPGDGLTGMRYGRVLTLFQLGRREEAELAWREARKAAPEVAKLLTAKARPKETEYADEFTAEGSEDEAWSYFMRTEELWKTSGARAWVRKLA